MRITLSGVCLVACAIEATAQASPQRELARILDSARAKADLPALAAAIVTRGAIWAYDAVGFRKLGDSTRVTRDDRFHLGSDTKAMTAGLAGLLVDERKLRWDSTIEALFPELRGEMRPEYRGITVRELLSHQSGLVANAMIEFPEASAREQRVRYVRWVLTQPPASPRGTYSYANANYVVIGAAIERILGVDFERAMQDRLFARLGITTAGWGAPATPGKIDQPWPHRVDAFGTRTAVAPGPGADNVPAMGPAGRVHMSIGDWARWAQVVMRAAAGDTSVWSASTARALVSPAVAMEGAEGYAMGWIVVKRPWAGATQRVLTHAGSNTMNFAVAWLAPDAGFGFLVATNQGGDAAARELDALTGRLIKLYQAAR